MSEDNNQGEQKTEPTKRITQAIKERIIHLKNNGLNTQAIAQTVDFSEAAVTAAIKVGK